ncbi:MAG: hypothetical protein E7214_02365 [Clostridium sp.]|nr:hypothetical protein [Clostridium sp.]
MKKKILFIMELCIITICGGISISAAEWPSPNNVNIKDGKYLKDGEFYWYGTWDYTEYYESWHSEPKLPNTLYGPTLDDLFLNNGAKDNSARKDFGFIAYGGYWMWGNYANPVWDIKLGTYIKPMHAYYRRNQTSPRVYGLEFQKDKCKHIYIDDRDNEKEIYWFRPNEDVFVNCINYQTFLGRYKVKMLDYIDKNDIRIKDQKGKIINLSINRNNNITSCSNNGVSLTISSTGTETPVESFEHPSDYEEKYNYADNTYYEDGEDFVNVERVINKLRVNFNKDGDELLINSRANSANGRQTNFGREVTVKTDGTAPIWDSIKLSNSDEYNHKKILSSNTTVDGFRLQINNLHDVTGKGEEGVGLDLTELDKDKDEYGKLKNQYITIDRLDHNGNKIGNSIRINECNYESIGESDTRYNLSYDINYEALGLENYYGNLSVEFHTSDLLGNNTSKKIDITKVNPTPINSKAKVVKSDYKENDSTYWVRPNSTFLIYTDSYIDSTYGEIFPDSVNLMLLKDNNSKNKYIVESSDIERNNLEDYDNGYFSESNATDVDFNKIANEFKNIPYRKGERIKLNNRNYLRTLHSLTALDAADKLRYRIYSGSSYEYDGITNELKKYKGEDMDSDIWLKVDGTPPTGTSLFNYNPDTSISEIKAKNVKDNNNGSGLQKVYVKYSVSPDDNYYEPDGDDYYDRSIYNPKPITVGLTNNNGVWESSTSLYDYFKCSRVVAEVYAVDNVGNENKIGEKTIDLYTLKAWIAPWNDKDSKEEVPTLKSGQYAHLYIKTTGGPTKLSIEFPYELTELIEDSNPNKLNREINIKEELCHIEDVEFCVPLYCPNKEYIVEVTSTKRKDRELKAYPKFRVDDNILKGVRTRLR